MNAEWGWHVMLYGSSFCAILYSSFLHWYRYHWDILPAYACPPDFFPVTSITILVPARNEENTILDCLEAIRRQNYPAHLLEVICIDDGSEDRTAQLIAAYSWPNVRLLRRSGGGKKAALEQGVSAAAGELIVTTDADCLAPPNWLRHLAAAYEQEDAAFIAAPVQFSSGQNLLQHFQALDFLGMMLLTGAGIFGRLHYLSNGANMAYPRKIFMEIGGYGTNRSLASGDDVFLVQEIARRYPERIVFVKTLEATVQTPSTKTLGEFWQQRLRWAGKNGQSNDHDLLLSLAQAFLYSWFIILSLILSPIYGTKSLLLFGLLVGIKAFQDYTLLRKATDFFQQGELLRYFWPSQIMHTLYIALIGLVAQFQKSYTWKGRRSR